jgi:hypothetical protein
MIRTFLITICFCTSVWANDIYVSQTPADEQNQTPTPKPNNNTPFQEPIVSEKDLISNTPTQYCSVIAGCLNSQ